MDLSLFLAKVLSIVLVLSAVAMLMNMKTMGKVVADFLKNSGVMMLGASLGLIMGALLVVSHNVWVSDWPVIITILGWLILVKSTLYLAFPELPANLAKKMGPHYFMGSSVVALALGLVLGYFAYLV